MIVVLASSGCTARVPLPVQRHCLRSLLDMKDIPLHPRYLPGKKMTSHFSQSVRHPTTVGTLNRVFICFPVFFDQDATFNTLF